MIRPIDLQATIFTVQNGPTLQRAEESVRIDAQTTQAAFAAQLTRRDETVAATEHVLPNKVGAKQPGAEQHGRGRRRPGAPRTAFEQVVDDVAAAASDDPPHIVDFTA